MKRKLYSIEGYPDYFVTLEGKVWSAKRNQFRILKPCKDKDGYGLYKLRHKGQCKTFKGHRLVALMFIPNPKGKSDVNHKDGNKLNNCVSNLEWCTRLENNQHGFRTGLLKHFTHAHRKKSGRKSALRNSRAVWQLTLEGKKIKRFKSAKEVQRKLGLWQSNISRCCNGQATKAFGYKWEYVK